MNSTEIKSVVQAFGGFRIGLLTVRNRVDSDALVSHIARGVHGVQIIDGQDEYRIERRGRKSNFILRKINDSEIVSSEMTYSGAVTFLLSKRHTTKIFYHVTETVFE